MFAAFGALSNRRRIEYFIINSERTRRYMVRSRPLQHACRI
jgi:hypothetical protein